MFNPKYTISDFLHNNIVKITQLVADLNNQRFPEIVLFEFAKNAQALSVNASTSIEGNSLPLTEVKKLLKFHPKNLVDSQREVLNYNFALSELNKLISTQTFKLTLVQILKIQFQVTAGLLAKYDTGCLRKRPVIVNNPLTGKIAYLPPDVADVVLLMEDLVSFINQKQGLIDSLILAGIFHKQMVIIHPFIDGNGRTTRLVTKALLAEMGLNTFNLFSFENYYNQNVTAYFSNVGEYGDYYDLAKNLDFSTWLEYFTTGLIVELERIKKLLPINGPTPDTYLWPHHLKVLDILRDTGFVTDRAYGAVTNRAKATRVMDFQKLIDMGLLERKGKGRSTYYMYRNLD